MKKSILTLLILLSTFCLVPLSVAALEKGEAIPPIIGETLEGKNFDLSTLKGEPVILKVGTTWCGTCKAQAKAINELNGFRAENGIRFVDVFIQESGKRVKKYLDKSGYQRPDTVVLDSGDISGELNIYLIPRIILLDKEHKVFRDGGDISSKKLKLKLQEMLADG